MEEIWKDIKGYEGLYQVSNFGRVKSLGRYVKRRYGEKFMKEKMRALYKDKDGYAMVVLHKNGKRSTKKVHRLVAKAFIPNPKNKPEVNHKDGNKENNNINNLEWCTRSENQVHAYRVLKRDYILPTRQQREKYLKTKRKEVIQYEIQVILREKARYKSIKEAGKVSGINDEAIGKCCRGTQKQAGGYIWRFKNDEIKDKD